MPIYEYKCNDCKNIFDEYHSVEKRLTAVCPECKSTIVTIQIHNFNKITLVGTGFYKNDYGWIPDMDRIARKYDEKRAKGWIPPSIDEQEADEHEG